MIGGSVGGVPIFLIVLPILLGCYFFLPQRPKPGVVGIDLGTTFSSIGAYPPKTGGVEIYPVDLEDKLSLPSIVTFTSNRACRREKLNECDVSFGRKLIYNNDIDAKRTFYDSKRFIGKSFDVSSESSLKEFETLAAHYPFDMLLNSTDGNVLFILPPRGLHEKHDGRAAHESDSAPALPSSVDVAGKLGIRTTLNWTPPKLWQLIHPEMVSGLLLRHMKGKAMKKLDIPVTDAVISVPADFDAEQKAATVRAAHLAGLNVAKLLSEPTAAALAYGLHEKEHKALVLVVDFGGGTLDVSLLERDRSMFFVLGIAGNNRLGGQDLTHALMLYIANQRLGEACRNQWGGKNLLEAAKDATQMLDTEDLQELRQRADEAKVGLTAAEVVEVPLKITLPKKCEVVLTLTRDQFEAAAAEVLAKVLEPVRAVLEGADATAEDVEEVVLVGGSTLVPKVRELIRGFFGGRSEMHLSVDPELAVVSGAAVQAGVTGNAWPIKVSALELPRDDLKRIECGEGTQGCSKNKKDEL